MPRKKSKGFAGEKSEQNQEKQRLEQADDENTTSDKPPFWAEILVNIMMISKLIAAIVSLSFRKPKSK